ncbi:hypothetical protein PMAYCL1PPCAC_02416 [Pristionchus mayeri]|uniref:Uncharacterized protein n=1 Tax=Pristionchus mayeri TaxID=1317129 RepID=A0AAN4Z1Q8_9BILA|nr:hypothetical protein PMAYCL1PPCAC_02416 [Pristionchus mayeri]
MAASELNDLLGDVTKELAAVQDSLRRKHIEFIPVLKTERHKITSTLNEMKDSLGSQLDVIDGNLDEEQARITINEIERLRARCGCLRDCRELLDKFSTVEAAMEEMRMLLDQNTLKCAETLLFAVGILPALDEMTSMKSEITEESTMAITKILYTSVSHYRNLLLGKLNGWLRQVVSFPHSRVPAITQMNVCVGDTAEASMNISAMSIMKVLDDWMIKLGDNIMKNIIHPVINGGGSSTVATTHDPVKSSLFIFRVKTSKKKGEVNVDAIFAQLLAIFTHLNASLIGVEDNTNSLVSSLMKIIFPQLQMAILKNVISPRSTNESEIEETMEKAEQLREQLVEIGLINDATPSFKSFAENHEKVFTDRKCITRLARARELVLAPYVELTTVGYGEEETDENKFEEDSLKFLDIKAEEALEDKDSSYPFFFRLLKCQISSTTKELVDLVRETVNEAAKAENEEMAGRLMLTARNMVEMFLLLTKSHATSFSSVPQMAAVYHNNCHYIGHRLMLMVFDVVNEKHAIILSSFQSFFAPFLVQLRASAQQVMSNQLLQIRRNISQLLSESSMSSVSSIEKGANACTMQLASISNVWKEVLPELVYCGAMSNVIGFFFDQLSNLMLTAEDITANDATFITAALSTTLRQIEKLTVIRGSPMLHKECTKPYFHFKEIIFMLNASLQDIDDRWCDGVGPLAECLSVKEIRHLVKALFSNSEQRKRLLDRFY